MKIKSLAFFVEHGVKLGAAGRFVHDIDVWVKGRGDLCRKNCNSSISICLYQMEKITQRHTVDPGILVATCISLSLQP